MTNLKKILKYIMYYILGNIIFNFSFSITKLIIYRFLGSILDIYIIFIENIKNTITIYTALFVILLIVDILYNKYLVDKLNKVLDRGSCNEE